MYELRPLSTGELLDRTFSLYRRRFWLYCGLSAVSATLSTLLQVCRFTILGVPGRLGAAQAPRALIISGVATMVTAVLYLLAYAVTQAATIAAVSSVYLGHETSMGKALEAVRPKWWRYILIALWQGWSAIWLFLLLSIPAIVLIGFRMRDLGYLLLVLSVGSLVYGVIAYLRNSLAVSASVFEGLGVRSAMRRSKGLSAGRKGSIFLLMVLLYVLNLVATGLQMPFALLLMSSEGGRRFLGQGMSLALGFVSSSLIGPVGAIALCLFYIDQRVRKEGFDIEALMDPTLGSGAPKAAAAGVLLPSGFVESGFTARSAGADPFAASGFTAAASSPPPSQSPVSPLTVATTNEARACPAPDEATAAAVEADYHREQNHG